MGFVGLTGVDGSTKDVAMNGIGSNTSAAAVPMALEKRLAVYEPLVQKLRQAVTQRDFHPGELIASEYELARREGISRRSVRRAVEILIREGKLERRPGKGVFVRTPAKLDRLVRIVVPDGGSDLFVKVARGVQEVGLKAGVRALIHDAHGRLESDLEMIRQLPRSSARGAVIGSVHHHDFAETLYALKVARYPFVLVDETLRDIAVPSVVADNYGGGRLVGEELLRRGHRRIGFVGFLGADTARARLEGLRSALANAGLGLPDAWVGNLRVPSSVTDEETLQREVTRTVHQLLNPSDRPTAIFFAYDLIAAQSYVVLRSLGLRIPEDISVVGFDGIPMCRLLVPTLATVRQPAPEMGGAAMEMLLDLMSGDPPAGGSRWEAGVVNGAARTPVAVPDGSKTNGRSDTVTRRHGDGRKITRNGKLETRNHAEAAWHRVLPVTWQDGDSLGPAPGAARDGRGDAAVRGYGDTVRAPELIGV